MESLAGDPFEVGPITTGDDGRPLVGNFRTGNALEQQDAAVEMTAHGYQRRTIVILEVGRARLSAPPLSWKRLKLKRLSPTVAEYTVLSINTDDSNVYAFVLVGQGTQ